MANEMPGIGDLQNFSFLMLKMANMEENKELCTNYPDFGAVCLFIHKFGDILGLLPLDIKQLQENFESIVDDVPGYISDLHIFLLRRLKRNVPVDKWERELVKFCDTYSYRDAWEVERLGYAKCKMSTKMAIIRNLLEAQFDANLKFIERLADVPEETLRLEPYGRDRLGYAYWLMQDESLSVRVFKHELDDDSGTSWRCLVRNRDELADLIEKLKSPDNSSLIVPDDRVDSSCYSPSASSYMHNDSCRATPVKFRGGGDSNLSTPVKQLQSSLKSQISSLQSENKTETTTDVKTEVKSEIKEEPETIKEEEDFQTEVKPEIPESEKTESKEEQVENQAELPQPNTAVDPGGTEGDGPSEVQPAENPEQMDTNEAQQLTEPTETTEPAKITEPTETAELEAQAEQADAEYEKPGDADSEDDIPLSQLKAKLKLINSTRQALQKAKKQHEIRKYKQDRQKKKNKLLKKLGKDNPSPVPIPQRNSGRQRQRPVFHKDSGSEDESEMSEEWLSDEASSRPKGRNARRQNRRNPKALIKQQESSDEVDNDDTPCHLCKQYTQPQLMLLCDTCDAGWHTACLKPPLFYIPDDDWYCPACEHARLLEKLEEHLVKLDEEISEREKKLKKQEQKEKYALANGIHPGNIIVPDEISNRVSRERRATKTDEYDYDSFEEDQVFTPYKSRVKRSCRTTKKVNYNFEEFDEMMETAIKSASSSGTKNQNTHDPTLLDDIPPSLQFKKAPPPPPGRLRGKDMSSILGADALTSSDEEENAKKSDDEDTEEEKENQEKPELTGKPELTNGAKPSSRNRRKKNRHKLTDLSDAPGGSSSDDEFHISEEGDEDFEEPTDVSEASDQSWAEETRRGSGRSRRNKRRRYEDDADFLNDESLSDDSTSRRRGRGNSRRSTRRSAAAAQAAVRRRREAFSSEEAATTPGSSEESESDGGRIVNRWNSSGAKKYGKSYGGKSKAKSKKSKKTEESKTAQRKRKRIVASFNSDESTNQEESLDSDEDYVPTTTQAFDDEPAEPAEEGEQEGEEEGEESDQSETISPKRPTNRIESSSEDEEEIDQSATATSNPKSQPSQPSEDTQTETENSSEAIKGGTKEESMDTSEVSGEPTEPPVSLPNTDVKETTSSIPPSKRQKISKNLGLIQADPESITKLISAQQTLQNSTNSPTSTSPTTNTTPNKVPEPADNPAEQNSNNSNNSNSEQPVKTLAESLVVPKPATALPSAVPVSEKPSQPEKPTPAKRPRKRSAKKDNNVPVSTNNVNTAPPVGLDPKSMHYNSVGLPRPAFPMVGQRPLHPMPGSFPPQAYPGSPTSYPIRPVPVQAQQPTRFPPGYSSPMSAGQQYHSPPTTGPSFNQPPSFPPSYNPYQQPSYPYQQSQPRPQPPQYIPPQNVEPSFQPAGYPYYSNSGTDSNVASSLKANEPSPNETGDMKPEGDEDEDEMSGYLNLASYLTGTKSESSN